MEITALLKAPIVLSYFYRNNCNFGRGKHIRGLSNIGKV